MEKKLLAPSSCVLASLFEKFKNPSPAFGKDSRCGETADSARWFILSWQVFLNILNQPREKKKKRLPVEKIVQYFIPVLHSHLKQNARVFFRPQNFLNFYSGVNECQKFAWWDMNIMMDISAVAIPWKIKLVGHNIRYLRWGTTILCWENRNR